MSEDPQVGDVFAVWVETRDPEGHAVQLRWPMVILDVQLPPRFSWSAVRVECLPNAKHEVAFDGAQWIDAKHLLRRLRKAS